MEEETCLALARRFESSRPITDLKCTSGTPIDLEFCWAASRSFAL